MVGITYPNIPYGDSLYVDKINANFVEIDTQLETTIPNEFNSLISLVNEKAKFATGSYIGTGTYGVGNQTTIIFPFIPKILIISCFVDANNDTSHFKVISGDPYVGIIDYTGLRSARASGKLGCNKLQVGNTKNTVVDSSETFTLYNGGYAVYQFNSSGYIYYWTAIG